MTDGVEGSDSELIRSVGEIHLRREELAFAREKWAVEEARANRRWWNGAPLNVTVLVTVIGGVITVVTALLQVQANRELERMKYESQLVLKALEPADSAERIARLSFLVNAGLIADPGNRLRHLTESQTLPQFAPGISTDVTPEPDATVAAASLNLRSGPSRTAPITAILPQGSALIITSCEGLWCRVGNGRVSGYVIAAYLNRRAQPAPPTSPARNNPP